MRIRPIAIDGYETRAKIWEMKGDYDRALADINVAIRVRTRQDLAALRRSRARAGGSGHRHSALDPTRATLRYRDELDRALVDCNEALRRVPDFIPAFTGRWRTRR
jgi:hypothetical protein